MKMNSSLAVNVSLNRTADVLPFDLNSVRQDIVRQLLMCQMRGLPQTCKWLSDLLLAIGGQLQTKDLEVLNTCYTSLTPYFSQYCLAKSLLDLKEYDRCAQKLIDVASKDQLLNFVYLYAKYLSAEKKWVEDELDLRLMDKRQQRGNVMWIKRELEDQMRKSDLDAYCVYLYGVVLKKLNLYDMAAEALCSSVTKDNTLWLAWAELVTLVDNKEQLMGLKIPNCWMKYFFESKVYMELHENERALETLVKLSNSGFAESANIKTDLAIVHDAMRHLDMATKQFEAVMECDPYRLDGMDVYSNVLFVRELHEELSHLANHCVKIDKYRPQTCCVVGNFYSLRGQHDKAVLYFQRALKLRPAYSLVWTLVGHEYMELNNSNAAIHAYRKAIEHNRRDFRAWYGLGQTYEMLKLPFYSLYYYREAQFLAPSDSRLVVALGEIYERLDRLDEAKKCFYRAYSVGDVEGGALVRLAKCHDRSGEVPEAAAAYMEFINLCERNGIHNESDIAQAYRYLSNFHMQWGQYQDAAIAAHKCLEFPETKEEGKAILRQITALEGDFHRDVAVGIGVAPKSAIAVLGACGDGSVAVARRAVFGHGNSTARHTPHRPLDHPTRPSPLATASGPGTTSGVILRSGRRLPACATATLPGPSLAAPEGGSGARACTSTAADVLELELEEETEVLSGVVEDPNDDDPDGL